MRDVLPFCVDGIPIANALLQKLLQFIHPDVKILGKVHADVPAQRISYKQWKYQPPIVHFDLLQFFLNFRSCSVDVKRLLSLSRIAFPSQKLCLRTDVFFCLFMQLSCDLLLSETKYISQKSFAIWF